jgi:hypothetical protein
MEQDDTFNDPLNMVGISDMVNRDMANKRVSLDELEKMLIGQGALQPVAPKDANVEYERAMHAAATGQSDDTEDDTHAAPDEMAVGEEEPEAVPSVPPVQGSPMAALRPRGGRPAPVPVASTPSRRAPAYAPAYAPAPVSYAPAPAPPVYPPQQYAQYPPPQYPPPPGYPPPQYAQYPPPQYPPPPGYPQPQYAPPQGTVSDALRGYVGAPATHEVTREEEEDNRMFMIDDIEVLLAELAALGVDVTTVTPVDDDTEFRIVRKVHSSLRRKYDRKRCETFGTEAILAGAHGLEWLFDGKKKYGPFQFDLTDWHNNIRPRLRKMRYETSGVASDLLHGLDVNNIGRIAMELMISAVLHNKARQVNRVQPAYSPDQMSDAYETLEALG